MPTLRPIVIALSFVPFLSCGTIAALAPALISTAGGMAVADQQNAAMRQQQQYNERLMAEQQRRIDERQAVGQETLRRAQAEDEERQRKARLMYVKAKPVEPEKKPINTVGGDE